MRKPKTCALCWHLASHQGQMVLFGGRRVDVLLCPMHIGDADVLPILLWAGPLPGPKTRQR